MEAMGPDNENMKGGTEKAMSKEYPKIHYKHVQVSGIHLRKREIPDSFAGLHVNIE